MSTGSDSSVQPPVSWWVEVGDVLFRVVFPSEKHCLIRDSLLIQLIEPLIGCFGVWWDNDDDDDDDEVDVDVAFLSKLSPWRQILLGGERRNVGDDESAWQRMGSWAGIVPLGYGRSFQIEPLGGYVLFHTTWCQKFDARIATMADQKKPPPIYSCAVCFNGRSIHHYTDIQCAWRILTCHSQGDKGLIRDMIARNAIRWWLTLFWNLSPTDKTHPTWLEAYGAGKPAVRPAAGHFQGITDSR